MHIRTLILILAAPTAILLFLGNQARAAKELTIEPLTRSEPVVRMVLQEANGQPFMGQVAVAGVALDRVAARQWPSTTNGVIYQPWQFTGMRSMFKGYSIAQIERARLAVRMARNGLRPCGPRPVFWYYAPKEMVPPGRVPKWARDTVLECEIGGHKFYGRK